MKTAALSCLLSCLCLLAACAAEEEAFADPAAAALLGEYDWVSSTVSAGGPQASVTPNSLGERHGLAITSDSLVYSLDGRRRRGEAYRFVGGWDDAPGVAVEAVSSGDGRPDTRVLSLELQPGGLLEVVPLDPRCVEGCADVYERVGR